jgi:hypothetical protein
MAYQHKTKTGRLTREGLACGYIETKSTNPNKYREEDLYTELYYEGGAYHVRQFDRRPEAKIFRVFWEGFPTLSKARALFDKQLGTRKRL